MRAGPTPAGGQPDGVRGGARSRCTGSGDRVDAEASYRLPVGARVVGTLRVLGLTTSPYGRDYRVVYGFGVLDQGNVSFEL